MDAMSGGFFRGTSVSQDARFADKTSQLLQSLRFPSIYRQKVDLRWVRLDEVSRWVQLRVVELVGLDDEVLVGLVLSTLMQAKAANRSVDPRQLQVDLTGFLHAKAETFTTQLWHLLLTHQPSPCTSKQPSATQPTLAPAPPASTAPPPSSSATSARRSRFGPPLPHTAQQPPVAVALTASHSRDVAARSVQPSAARISPGPPPSPLPAASPPACHLLPLSLLPASPLLRLRLRRLLPLRRQQSVSWMPPLLHTQRRCHTGASGGATSGDGDLGVRGRVGVRAGGRGRATGLRKVVG